MANVTFISDKISRIAAEQIEIPDKLNAVAALLENEYGLRVNFCRIFGKRWSYVAGDRQMEFALNRIRLNQQYGIIYVQNKRLSEDDLERILQALTQFLAKNSNE